MKYAPLYLMSTDIIKTLEAGIVVNLFLRKGNSSIKHELVFACKY